MWPTLHWYPYHSLIYKGDTHIKNFTHFTWQSLLYTLVPHNSVTKRHTHNNSSLSSCDRLFIDIFITPSFTTTNVKNKTQMTPLTCINYGKIQALFLHSGSQANNKTRKVRVPETGLNGTAQSKLGEWRKLLCTSLKLLSSSSKRQRKKDCQCITYCFCCWYLLLVLIVSS